MSLRLRNILRQAVGERTYAKLQVYRRDRANRQFARGQTAIELQVGNFLLRAPSAHVLAQVQATQPFRDLAIGLVAREIARKYPGETLLDIGANIGDTAALIATYSSSPIIAVEPSDFFHPFLVKNAARIPSIVQVHKAMVSGQAREQGVLIPRGGTAQFERLARSNQYVDCKSLEQVADGCTRFIKIDTDGFDVPILASSMTFLAKRLPCLYYEVEGLTDAHALESADRVIEELSNIGYQFFVVFDDIGLHLVSTTDIGVVRNLNRYLLKVLSAAEERALYNYDVLCLPASDEDIFKAVTAFYANY